MNNSNEIIVKTIYGLLDSIEKMNTVEKRGWASFDYGEEINKIFKIVRDTNPELKDLIPNDIKFDKYEAITPWNEIHAKLNQVYQLLI